MLQTILQEWPVELAGVSRSTYFVAIIFEFSCFLVIAILNILGMQRYFERKQKASLYVNLLYFGYAFGLILTVLSKVLIYYFESPFLEAHYYEKIALLGIITASGSLLAFDFEIYTKIPEKRKIGYLSLIIIPSIGFVLYEFSQPDQLINMYTSIALLIINFIPSYYHFTKSKYMYGRAETELEKKGMLFILLQGVFQILYLVALVGGTTVRALNILPPFNFTYYLRFLFLVGSILCSYLGYFMPEWFKKRLQHE